MKCMFCEKVVNKFPYHSGDKYYHTDCYSLITNLKEMNKKVDITLHGILAKQMSRDKWKLKVKNVSEAIRGIESNSGKFYNNLLKNDRKHIKY